MLAAAARVASERPRRTEVSGSEHDESPEDVAALEDDSDEADEDKEPPGPRKDRRGGADEARHVGG